MPGWWPGAGWNAACGAPAPYQCTTSLHPISEVANLEKKVPLEWVNADHTAMLPEFLAYAMPLIQAELTPIYVEGLPHHIYLPET